MYCPDEPWPQEASCWWRDSASCAIYSVWGMQPDRKEQGPAPDFYCLCFRSMAGDRLMFASTYQRWSDHTTGKILYPKHWITEQRIRWKGNAGGNADGVDEVFDSIPKKLFTRFNLSYAVAVVPRHLKLSLTMQIPSLKLVMARARQLLAIRLFAGPSIL